MNPEKIKISPDNIQIIDSFEVSKKEFDDYLDYVESVSPDNPVIDNRSRFSLIMEWTSHNALYDIGIYRERTKDVDLDYPQKWYMTVGYILFGLLSYLFVK